MDVTSKPGEWIAAFPETLLGRKLAGRLALTRHGLVLCEHLEQVRQFARILKFFDPIRPVHAVTADLADSDAPAAERGETIRALLALGDTRPVSVLLPAAQLAAWLRDPAVFLRDCVHIARGEELDLTLLAESLTAMGYERVHSVWGPGTYAVRGSIVDVFAFQDAAPARVDFDGDRVADIRRFNPESQISSEQIGETLIPPLTATPGTGLDLDAWAARAELFAFESCEKYIPAQTEVTRLTAYPGENEGERVEEPALPPGLVHQVEFTQKLLDDNWAVVMALPEDLAGRVAEFYVEKSIKTQILPEGRFSDRLKPGLYFCHADLASGYRDAERRILLLGATDIFPRRRGLEPTPSNVVSRKLADILELNEGDFVVHEQYGIGIYRGLKRLTTRDEEGEFISIEYRGKDILYVPLDKFHFVQKYIGTGRKPQPNKLGDAAWQRVKKKAKEQIQLFARDLLGLYAAREHNRGFAFSPDTVWQKEFELKFPYEETADQKRAIADVKTDMESDHPMDRLICGDAGFGKTEVALRAACKAVMDGKQVAVVVPTTLLAEQHTQVFKERFSGFSTEVADLSRFRTRKEQAEVIAGLKSGEIDICVGTHRLLQDDVAFKDLGLVIIDEEHRFGVKQKEKLKFFRSFVDVISMSATPIPRTLYMSMIGARDVSLIETPPVNRVPIKTEIHTFGAGLIRESILRELQRGGQAFVLFNEVKNIEKMAERIRRFVPEARVCVGHGQMNEEPLEDVILAFYHGKFDVLVSTTIIESGLDMPNVNTILIVDADRFGLSSLYQLRGRVGRSDRPAYCHLLMPEGAALTADARRRLEAIAAITDVGGGYRVALEDLTIRGAGNLIGAEQHGVVWEIGFDMYCEMLKTSIVELRGQTIKAPWNIAVELKIPQFIPETLLPDATERITAYRKLVRCTTLAEIETAARGYVDRFGDLPEPLENLILLRKLKTLAETLRITEIIEWTKQLSVYTDRAQTLIQLTRTLKPAQVTPRQIEYPLRGLTSAQFLKSFVGLLGKAK